MKKRDYYYLTPDGEKHGPLSFAELLRLYRSEELPGNTAISRGDDWMSLRDLLVSESEGTIVETTEIHSTKEWDPKRQSWKAVSDDFSDKFYYRGAAGDVQGPVSAAELYALQESGELPLDAAVKREGDNEWGEIEVRSVSHVFVSDEPHNSGYGWLIVGLVGSVAVTLFVSWFVLR